MTTSAVPAVLIVEDDPDVLALLQGALAEDGFRVARAGSLEDARKAMRVWQFACCIINVTLPDGDGIDFAGELRSDDRFFDLPLLVTTSSETHLARALATVQDGLFDLVLKPIPLPWLRAKVRTFVQSFGRSRELQKREDVLRALLNAIPNVVLAIDKRGTVFECNESASRGDQGHAFQFSPLLGMAHEKIWPILLNGDDAACQQAARLLQTVLDRDEGFASLELQLRNGQVKRLEVSHLDGMDGVLASIADFTDTRRAEIDFREGAERMQLALEAGNFNAWSFNITNNERIAGSRDRELFGKDVLGPDDLLALVDPEDRERVRDAVVGETYQQRRDYRIEFRIHRDDGVRWLSTMAKFARNPVTGVERVDGVTWDITEHKRNESRALESEARAQEAHSQLLKVLDSGHMVAWEWDMETRERKSYGNDEKFFGYTPDTIDDAEAAIHSDDRERDDALFLAAYLNDTEYRNEFRMHRPDGQTIWLLSTGSRVKRDGKLTSKMAGLVIDITDRKNAEAEAWRQRDRLLAAVDSARMLAWQWDMQSMTRTADGDQEELLGFSPINPPQAESLIHPDDLKRDDLLFNDAYEKGHEYQNEFRIRHRLKGERWFLSSGRRLRNPDGSMSNIMAGVSFDVTDRKRVDAEVKAVGEQLRLALESAQMICWEWNLDTGARQILGNQAALYGRELSGIDELKSKMFADDLEQVERELKDVVEHDRPYNVEYRIRWDDGSLHWIQASGRPLRNEDGRINRVAGVAYEITARKRIELDLMASQSRLEDAMQAGRMCCWNWEVEADAWNVNGMDLELFGERLKSNQQAIELVHPDDRAKVANFYTGLARNGGEAHAELRLKWRDGTEHWVANHGRRSATSSNGHTVVTGVAWDITSRKNLELAMVESERLMRLAIVGGGINVFDINLTTGERKGGHLDLAFYGFSPGTREESMAMVFDEDRDEYASQVRRGMESRDRVENTFRVRHRQNGRVGWFHSIGQVVLDAVTNTQRMVGVTFDITKTRNAEIALQEAEQRWNFALEGSGAGVWDWNVEAGEVFYSAQWKAMLGYGEREMGTGTEEWLDRVHPEDREQVVARLQAHLKGESHIYESEHRMRWRDGSWIWVQDRGQVVARLPDGTTRRVVGTCIDISERRKQSVALADALNAAEEASRAKSAFLASMSHEIRTPMNAVIGMTGLLLDTPLDVKQKEMGRTIRSSGEVLLNLINDILDFSKIEAGQLLIEYAPFDLYACIESGLDVVAGQAEAKGLDLVCTITGVQGRRFVGDLTRLRQVVVNLAGNAVKFTAQGAVAVNVSVLPLDDDQVWLECIVEDTGIGMSESVQRNLFMPFRQGDASTTRKFGGTGLGLAITRQLVDIMKGEIEVSSVHGHGSRFTVRIPLLLDPELSVEQPSALQGLKAMMLGRRQVTLHSVHRQLDDAGVQVHLQVPEGNLTALLNTHAFDAILVGDDLDEDDLQRCFAGPEDLAQLPPMILFSRLNQNRRASKFNELIRARLGRPILPSRLKHALVNLKSTGADTTLHDPTNEEEALAERYPLRILVAEDNSVNQTLVDMMLESLGYRCDLVTNGVEVLSALQRQAYDVILMDVEMPEMDGIEATKTIRNNTRDPDVPRIIATTAHVLSDSRERFVSAGMNDYISKPILIEELRHALARAWHGLHDD